MEAGHIILPERDNHWNPESAHAYQWSIWDAALPYVRSWRVAIDCGAHVGIFTRRMEDKFEDVYAFEPQADVFRCLAQNTQRARLFNCLLWSEPAKLGMRLADHPNSGAAEVDRAADGTYPAMRLDAFGISEAGLIKIDVQDSETDILMGASQTLSSKPVLIVENSGRDPRLVPMLSDIGYRCVVRVRRDEVWVR